MTASVIVIEPLELATSLMFAEFLFCFSVSNRRLSGRRMHFLSGRWRLQRVENVCMNVDDVFCVAFRELVTQHAACACQAVHGADLRPLVVF